MFRCCRSHCSLLHKFTSGYPKDACSGFIFDAKTGTMLLSPVYYEISGPNPCDCCKNFLLSGRSFCSVATGKNILLGSLLHVRRRMLFISLIVWLVICKEWDLLLILKPGWPITGHISNTGKGRVVLLTTLLIVMVLTIRLWNLCWLLSAMTT